MSISDLYTDLLSYHLPTGASAEFVSLNHLLGISCSNSLAPAGHLYFNSAT
ncbi:hypothetical protein BN903_1 [Halorubrum sp. AJ67]|nr:hypothetical protein BN903_1 [Halorubrum sp. AJ67]